MKTLPKFTQLNFIGDIYHPNYSKDVVYIACHKINRSKLDIKLRFSQVEPTNEYAGDWFITRKKAKSFRKKFDNNKLQCFVIPMSAFERIEVSVRSPFDW